MAHSHLLCELRREKKRRDASFARLVSGEHRKTQGWREKEKANTSKCGFQIMSLGIKIALAKTL